MDPANPQTLNRYAYVRNNPLALIDPSGLYPACGPGVPLPCTDTSTAVAPGGSDSFLYQIYFAWYYGYGNRPNSGGGGPGTGGGGTGTPTSNKPPANQRPPANESDCLPPSTFVSPPGQPNLVQGALALTRIAAKLTNRTVGIGIGGGAGVRLGPGFLPGGQVSGSAMVATDRSGNSSLVFGGSSQVAFLSSNQLSYEYGAAANFGLQLMVSSQSPNQLPSASVSGSYQNFAVDINSSGFSLTGGFGVGARAGFGAGPAPSVAIPVCHQ